MTEAIISGRVGWVGWWLWVNITGQQQRTRGALPDLPCPAALPSPALPPTRPAQVEDRGVCGTAAGTHRQQQAGGGAAMGVGRAPPQPAPPGTQPGCSPASQPVCLLCLRPGHTPSQHAYPQDSPQLSPSHPSPTPRLQVIVGVNKYAQHDDPHHVSHDVDVRKIDNSAVLQRQMERLQVRCRAAARLHGRCGRCCCSRQHASGAAAAHLHPASAAAAAPPRPPCAARAGQPGPGGGRCGAGAAGGGSAQRAAGRESPGTCGRGGAVTVRGRRGVAVAHSGADVLGLACGRCMHELTACRVPLPRRATVGEITHALEKAWGRHESGGERAQPYDATVLAACRPACH